MRTFANGVKDYAIGWIVRNFLFILYKPVLNKLFTNFYVLPLVSLLILYTFTGFTFQNVSI